MKLGAHLQGYCFSEKEARLQVRTQEFFTGGRMTPFILRRANGEVFTITINDAPHVAVWDGELAVRRSKNMNPDLIVYVPIPPDRRLIERQFAGEPIKFFLVDSSDPDLMSGREIGEDELFSQAEVRQAA
jgi:hypothetical protein